MYLCLVKNVENLVRKIKGKKVRLYAAILYSLLFIPFSVLSVSVLQVVGAMPMPEV